MRFKARLVARGFTQAYGVDYHETYAPVAKLTTYRIIFTLAALEQWEIHGMDVITAFLLGKLDEEIFMMQPEGFERQGMKIKMVCRLLCSLYGLKQVWRVWNIDMNGVLVSTLVRLGFSGTALKPPRIFMYLSLQQFILSNLVLVLRCPWLVLRPSLLVPRELRSSFRVSRDSLRNSLQARQLPFLFSA